MTLHSTTDEVSKNMDDDSDNDGQKDAIKMNKLKGPAVYDDALYCISANMKNGSRQAVISYCAGRYTKNDISAARTSLVENYDEMLNNIDKKIVIELKKNRRDCSRSAKESMVGLVYDALITLDGNDVDVLHGDMEIPTCKNFQISRQMKAL